MQKLEQISKIVKLCKQDGAENFYTKMLNTTEDAHKELLEVLKTINVSDLMNSSLKDIELIIDDIVDI